jgi:acyl-homoserine lactone acylase PvdQ
MVQDKKSVFRAGIFPYLLRMKKFWFLLLFPVVSFAQPFSPAEISQWKKQAQRITIHRDKWGIPHVYGKSDADAVFGLLYAQCEDDFERVELNYINALGRLAEVEGESAIYSDLRARLFSDTVKAQGLYTRSPEWLKKIMNAFADGVNYYLATHPQTKPKLLTRFHPWLPLMFSEGSIGGDISSVSLNGLSDFYGKGEAVSDDDSRLMRMRDQHYGSNGISIAPSLSASGSALFLINPHTSFYFRSEVHTVSEEGLNVYGAVTWGQFFIYQGFNPWCGWMHTSSAADVVDFYAETVEKRGTGWAYKHGDEWRPVTSRTVTLACKTERGLVKREFVVHSTHHGPVVRLEGNKWVSVRMMDSPIEALSQSFLRTKAKGYADFRKVMEYRTNSSNNTVYADAQGNIAYWHGNFMPRRDARYNYHETVDGSDPTADWKGLHEPSEMIHILNPANGWIQNCNSTPFTAAGPVSPKREDYPRYMAPDGRNARDDHAVKVLTGRTGFTLDKLIEAAYDPELTGFRRLLPGLIEGAERSSELGKEGAGPLKVLKEWDYNSGVNSVAATLAVLWGRNIRSIASPRLERYSQEDLDEYEYYFEKVLGHTGDDDKALALKDAVDQLVRDFGTWQVPWGEMNRFQRVSGRPREQFDDSKPSLPVGFGSGYWGSLASIDGRSRQTTKRIYGTYGNSFVAVVEFGKRIRARSILSGGQSNDPSSPHFMDQAEMYAKGQFKDVLFYKEDILKNLERTYKPGN